MFGCLSWGYWVSVRELTMFVCVCVVGVLHEQASYVTAYPSFLQVRISDFY